MMMNERLLLTLKPTNYGSRGDEESQVVPKPPKQFHATFVKKFCATAMFLVLMYLVVYFTYTGSMHYIHENSSADYAGYLAFDVSINKTTPDGITWSCDTGFAFVEDELWWAFTDTDGYSLKIVMEQPDSKPIKVFNDTFSVSISQKFSDNDVWTLIDGFVSGGYLMLEFDIELWLVIDNHWLDA